MAQHICTRCGLEGRCSSGNWADRHPTAAVISGLFTLVFMGMMFSEYPVAAAAMTALATIWLGVRAHDRARQRRAALAARADYEHALLMARSMPQPIHLPPPAAPARVRQVAPPRRDHPTAPMRTR